MSLIPWPGGAIISHYFSWTLRIVCGLIMSTSLSLRASRVMKLERFQPHDYTWYFALSLVSLGSSILGILLNLSPCNHRVPWLHDSFTMEHVEDKGDVWTKTWADDAIDFVHKTLLAPIPSAPPIVESFQMQLKKGADYVQEVSDTKQKRAEGDSKSLPPPYANCVPGTTGVENDGGFSSGKKSTEARRRKRDSKPFINFKTAITVISKLVRN